MHQALEGIDRTTVEIGYTAPVFYCTVSTARILYLNEIFVARILAFTVKKRYIVRWFF